MNKDGLFVPRCIKRFNICHWTSSDPVTEPVPSTSTSQNTPATDVSLDFAASACRSTPLGGKRKRSEESPMEQAGRTMSALSTLMAAKHSKPRWSRLAGRCQPCLHSWQRNIQSPDGAGWKNDVSLVHTDGSETFKARWSRLAERCQPCPHLWQRNIQSRTMSNTKKGQH